jgi:hypothetical protein
MAFELRNQADGSLNASILGHPSKRHEVLSGTASRAERQDSSTLPL